MQSTKARGSPKESPQKVSPRPVRQLKIINPSENSSLTSSNNAAAPKTPMNRSPKVTDRKSPGRTPISEKKRPSRVSELESQISQLENDLKNAKDELVISESSKREAQEERDQVKKRLADVSLKLDESQKHISTLVPSQEVNIEHRPNESNALECARNEIFELKQKLETVQNYHITLTEAIARVERMKIELIDCKESESRAKEMVRETSLQLEAAKETVDALRLDVKRSSERSKERVDFLEGVVRELNALKSEQSQKKSMLNEEEEEVENEVERLRKYVADLKASVTDKEKEIKNITEENEVLKLEIKDKGDDVAMTWRMMEEIEKSKREQLEAAQAEKTEIEAELKKMKVQSHQWRKAAEAAASMLSLESDESNGSKCVERTGSMPVGARVGSPFLGDFDEGLVKKKNENVLKKIGVLWKKPQK